MCGIAGICGPGLPETASADIGRMLEAMAHRGPDDEGTWLDPEGRCAFGHKRLAVIDPEGGHQPLSNEDGSVWITYNGCVYNYEDIRQLLRPKGHVFRTHSDTEVIVHAYEEWGERCVERFNGAWAFAIWDGRKKTLFCSRDRLGIKPFHYVWDGERFTFASEIKALLAAGAVKAEPDPDGLRQYLAFQFCLEEQTLFKGVRKLPAGHHLVLKPGRAPKLSRYWDLSFGIDEEHGEAYFVDQLRWLLEDAVRLRLRADVPLGAALSGGIDSSAVVNLARLVLGREAPLATFTGAFREGEAFDETRYARLAAEGAGAKYVETYISAEQFPGAMESLAWHMDEPAAGPGIFPQYLVSKLAGERVRVLLGGQGGDELFIGYARYLVAYLEECLRGAIEDTAHRAQYVATLETIVPSLPSLELYVPMLRDFWREGLFGEPARRYYRLMDRFADGRSLLHPAFKVDAERTFEEFRGVFESRGALAMVNHMQVFDLKAHLPALLHVDDRINMAWGIESRVPLLDHRLVELIASVPPVVKFRNGLTKHLFRKAVENLVPRAILNRRDKMGFPVPLAQWMKGELREFVADVLLGQRSRERRLFDVAALERAISSEQPFGRAIWGALSLELWYRQFIDG